MHVEHVIDMRFAHVIEMPLPRWLVPLSMAARLAHVTVFATAFAVLSRRFRYGGVPRPAEWICLITLVATAALAMPTIDEAVNLTMIASGILDSPGDAILYHNLHRWRWAVGAMVAASSFLWLSKRAVTGRWERARIPLLLTAILATLWGPAALIPQYLPDWLIPSHQFHLHVGINRTVTVAFPDSLPVGLLLAVPAISALRSLIRGRGRGWRWTGAVGGISAAIAGAGLMTVSMFQGFPNEIRAEWAFIALSFVLSIPLVRPFERATWLVDAGSHSEGE